MKKINLMIIAMLVSNYVLAQGSTAYKVITQDSMLVRIHARYDSVSGIHRLFFGENYRKEWGTLTKLPVFRISEIHGGLTPEKEGGGLQTTSLRLIDPTGKEWVLRSIEKDPVKVLPFELRQTFARQLLLDAMSAQHPFSSLVVPPLAEAAGIPHAAPMIGVVSGDKALGKYNSLFEGMVCLLEEREPTGNSENTLKTMVDLYNNNDYSFDAKAFLRARCLDVLVGDWDRHDDNWRFTIEKNNKKRVYIPVPRDRDQAMYVNQGVIPWLTSRDWAAPNLQTFNGSIRDVRYSLWSSTWLDRYPSARLTYNEWMKVVNDFVAVETDLVFEDGLKRMPKEIYRLRHAELLQKLRGRRQNLAASMSSYYCFVNKIIDMHLSNSDELVKITQATNNGLTVAVSKLRKNGDARDSILTYTFDPAITKEVRFYLGEGNDNIVLNNGSSPIKIKFVDSLGKKDYQVISSAQKISLFDQYRKNLSLSGDTSRLKLHISKDSANTAFLPVNQISTWMPLINGQVNKDDGLVFGLGFRYTGRSGFRTKPYSEIQELLISHSFATKAFDVSYHGEWIHAIGMGDLLLDANVKAPNNTINFFGLGNESKYIKTGDYNTYYRTRFNTYLVDPALRWRYQQGISFSVGPSFQYYHLNPADNAGRFINNTSLIHSYDSLTVAKYKLHAGLTATFSSDQRNNKLLPTSGSYISVKAQTFAGLNSFARGYTQITGEASFYKNFADTTFVIADRIGGGATFGSPAFYQSLFLGGDGNLLGYRQFRFAGQQMLYNNLELRVRLFQLASYVLPGQFGLTGFFDTGRVWVDNEYSDKWHTGTGGGFYFMPAGLTIFQVVAGHSSEGWYPYVTLKMRF